MNAHSLPPRHGDPAWRQILRSLAYAPMCNPFAFIVAGAAVWPMVHLIVFLARPNESGHGWSLAQFVECGACALTMGILVIMVVAHIALTFVALGKHDVTSGKDS